jgi:hypothetical protein
MCRDLWARVEVQTAAVEVNRYLEVLPVAEPISVFLIV